MGQNVELLASNRVENLVRDLVGRHRIVAGTCSEGSFKFRLLVWAEFVFTASTKARRPVAACGREPRLHALRADNRHAQR